MTTTPALTSSSDAAGCGATTSDLIDIEQVARLIASDGTLIHHRVLGELADCADEASALPGAAAVLRDRDAPEATRARAFLAITRQWDTICAAAIQKAAFEQSFADLAAQWVAHQELRILGDIRQLVQSGDRLNELRREARRYSLAATNC